jgi:hypothetical protein
MNAIRIETLAIAAGLTLAALAAPGCASDPDAAALGLDAPPAPATAAPASQGAALRIEQAERSLDVGRDVAGARASLEEVVRDPSTSPEQREQAKLALSRALEAQGDKEAAIATVEALLAGHDPRTHFPAQEAAEARLRKLLTGSDHEAHVRPEDTRQAPPFAQALAKYYPAPTDPKQAIQVNLLMFGGDQEASRRSGAFDVDRALRQARREACALCDDKLPVQTHASRYGSWVSLPQNRAALGSALVVYYFDLGDGRVPARYDADLPLPSAEIAAHLSRGEGLVAARERPGAPPVIVIAAPREAQLADVEEALSMMKAMPLTPTSVPVKADLKAAEIQTVVRGAFKSYRGCYEALLQRSPGAAGKVTLHFAVLGDGSVDGVTADASQSLTDATFDACMISTTGALAFPATGAGRTTVAYPVDFSPGE